MNNYNFFMELDVSKYIGKWIAICDEKVVSSGKNPKRVLKLVKAKCPNKRPLLTKVPEKATMIF